MRWVGRLFALVGFLLFVAVGTLGTAGYLAATGRDLTLLDTIVRSFGRRVAGQRTERMVLDVTVDPDDGLLSGRAQLTVKATGEGRQRFYFLLGDAFRLGSFQVAGHPQARAYKLWLITVVDLGRPVAAEVPMTITLSYEGRPQSGLFGLGNARVSPRDIQLSVDSFWFPNDLQGPFQAEVGVTLPSYLTVVHAGDETERSTRGEMQRIAWRYARPIASLSLVAGPYRVFDLDHTGDADAAEVHYRVYLADDVKLDPDRILRMAADADSRLSAHYGPAGYSRLSLFVTRKLRRAYNDGAGLMGLSIRYFRRGDYGYNVIAHELAHNWFGATVMEKWLSPGTGGEWLVEGFAEFSSLVAVEERYGREALVRRLAGNFYDPRRDGVVARMSVLDNAVGDDSARDVIYAKGGWVAMMLRRLIGDAGFFPAMRGFLSAHRYQGASDADLESALAQTGVDVAPFFAEWVRSARGLDIAIEPAGAGMALRNLGDNTAVGAIVVAGAEPPPAMPVPAPDPNATPGAERAPQSMLAPALAFAQEAPAEPTPQPESGVPAEAGVGDEGAMRPAAPALRVPEYRVGHMVVAAGPSMNADPDLAYADMWRDNNLQPRQRFPLALAAGPTSWAEIDSEAFPWSAATLKTRGPEGDVRGTWELPSTVVSFPRWVDEHLLVLNTTDASHRSAAVELFDTRNGQSRVIGRGVGPTVASAAIYAVQGDSIVRWQTPAWEREVVLRQKRHAFGAVVASPDGTRLAYAAARDNDMEIRVLTLADRSETVLLRWDRDLRDLVWSADGTRLYAGIGGEWDWQLWEIPVDGSPVVVLAREAAAIGNLALSADGTRLALTAAAELDYPYNRREVIVFDVAQRTVQRFAAAGQDVRQVVWLDETTLLGVAAPMAPETPFTLPDARRVLRIDLASGTVAALP